MGIPNKQQALSLAAAGLGLVIVTSAAFAAEPPVPPLSPLKPAISEALPKTLPMPDIEELRVSMMRRELQVKNLERQLAAAELPRNQSTP